MKRKKFNHRFHRLGNGFGFWAGDGFPAKEALSDLTPSKRGLSTAPLFRKNPKKRYVLLGQTVTRPKTPTHFIICEICEICG